MALLPAIALVVLSLSEVLSAHVFLGDTSHLCVEAAEALQDVVEFYNEVPRDANITIQELIMWVSSVNINDREKLKEVICNIAGDIPSAVDYMDRSGILEAITRRAYDMGMVMVQIYRPMLSVMASMGDTIPVAGGKQIINPSPIVMQMLETLDELGFTILDPHGVSEGVRFMEQLGIVDIGKPSRTGERHMRDTEFDAEAETCQQLQPQLKKILTTTMSEIYPGLVVNVREFLGVDMDDDVTFRNLICEVTTSNSISEIVEVLRSQRVFTSLFTIMRQSVTDNGPRKIASQEAHLESSGLEMTTHLRERAVKLLRLLRAMRALGLIPE